jgi:hypothetical protein
MLFCDPKTFCTMWLCSGLESTHGGARATTALGSGMGEWLLCGILCGRFGGNCVLYVVAYVGHSSNSAECGSQQLRLLLCPIECMHGTCRQSCVLFHG